MAIYSIKDLEKLSGIQAHTIRIWEKRYKLVQPKRTHTNIRVYSDDDLKRLLNVAILNGNGLKISKIAGLTENEVKDRILTLTDDSSKTENQIDTLILAMIDLNEHKFEKILSRLVIQVGFEEAITQVIYPFLVKIGVLWQTGNINPAQEHFVTNLIRQKLFVAIDSVLVDELPEKKRFILFLPEGELHDIGLLYYNYLLKKNGHHVLYLGQSVPFPDIVEVHKMIPAEYLVTSFTTSIPHEMLNEYLNVLSKTFLKTKIFIIGSQTDTIDLKKFPNISKMGKPTDLRTFLKNL